MPIVRTIDNANPATIRLQEINNKLRSNGFVVIGFAPKEKIETWMHEVHHQLENGNLVRLVEVIELEAVKIGNWATIPATGMTAGEFWRWWIQSFPDTTDDTMMGVYYYQRVK